MGALALAASLVACAGSRTPAPNWTQHAAEQERHLARQDAEIRDLRSQVEALRSLVAIGFRAGIPSVAKSTLGDSRGAGPGEDAAAREAAPANASGPASASQESLEGGAGEAQATAQEVAGESPAETREQKLEESIPPRVGGVLLAKGRLQLEPQVRYGYSSVNRVEITGYTILPAITLGVIDVTKRDTSSFTTALGIRYGLLEGLEVDLAVPFIAGWSRSQFSPVNTDPPQPTSVSADGYDVGDVLVGVRYQLNHGTPKVPSFVAGLSARFPTGTDPYEVARHDMDVQYLEKELPTGSGFYALSSTVSFVYPAEPAVIFGNVRYSWNMERDIHNIDVATGEPYGKIDPGDVIGASLGFGISLNDSFSFMLSYDHAYVFRTYQHGKVVDGSNPLQIGSLGIGATWRSSPRTSYNLFVGIGVTDDAPDVSIGLRVPITFDLGLSLF